MLDAEQTFTLFGGLRRAQTQRRYAPHKPLLALARIQRGAAPELDAVLRTQPELLPGPVFIAWNHDNVVKVPVRV